MDNEKTKCQCQDCGKFFNFGEEGDNEKFCLRCEHIALIEKFSDQELDEIDRQRTNDRE
jgi:hypothetical protein